MNYRTYSRTAVWWILVDMMLRSLWLLETLPSYSELIRVVRIVVPLLLAAGVGYYIIRKQQDEDAVEEPWWEMIMLLCLFLFMSTLAFFHWH